MTHYGSLSDPHTIVMKGCILIIDFFRAYQTDISSVLTVLENLSLPAGTGIRHAQFDTGLLNCDKGQVFGIYIIITVVINGTFKHSEIHFPRSI